MRPLVNSSSFSPKSANHSTSGSHVSDDGLDYHAASPSRLKGKKRERENDSLKMVKRVAVKSTSSLKPDIAKLIEKGELADLEAVDEIVQLMHTDKIEKKMDLVCRSNIAGAISSTSKFECLSQFVELGGLCILDEWIQEVHKGKTGDINSPSEGNKSVEEFLLSLLDALDKLPVNLPELRMSNIGKSVNMLRSHKNMDIRKKARRLVHLWKKRVEAELAQSSAKDGCTEKATASAKSPASGGSHDGNKSPCESPPLKHSSVETQMLVSVAAKSEEDSMAISKSALLLKGIRHKTSAGDGGHDAPLHAFEDDKSCNSSLSHTSQSCSSDQINNGISPKKEDSQSSCAGSLTNKLVNDRSRDKKLLSDTLGPAFPSIHKESRSKRIILCRYKPTKRVSHSEVSIEKENKVPITSGYSHKLIVKFPNRICGPFKSMTDSSPEKPPVKPDHSVFISKGSSEFRKPHVDSALMIESWQSNECMDTLTVSDRGEGSATTADKENLKNVDGGMNISEVSKDIFSSSLVRKELVSCHERSTKSLSFVTEGRPRKSEICKTVTPGYEGGMVLLADVATCDMFESDVSGHTNTPMRTLEVGNSSPGSVCLSANVNNNVQGSLVHTEQQADEDFKKEVEAGETLATLKNRATISPFDNNLCRNLDHSMMQVEHTKSLVNEVSENSGNIVVTLSTVAVTSEIVVRQSTNKVVEEEIGERMDKSVSNGENTLEKAVDTITDELASKPIIGSDTSRHMVVDMGLSSGVTPSAIVSNAMEEREGDVSLEMDARNKVKGCLSGNTNASAMSGVDSRLKFGFDLNETCDDGENLLGSPSETLPISSDASGAFSASVTVAAATKGPFNPPGDLLKNKGEVGWKGSAATSAFRPAEPRKAITIQSSTISDFVPDTHTTKESQRVLDFDLNEAYVGSPENAQCASVLDPYSKMFIKSADSSRFDLNLSDQMSPGKGYKPGFPPFLSKKAVNISAVPLKNQSSFDLNSCLDEVATDISPFERKSLRSHPGIVMNSVGRTNIFPWFPGSTVSAQVPWLGERSIPLTSLEVGTSNMPPRPRVPGNTASTAIPLFGANIVSTAIAEEAQMFMNLSNGMPMATPGGPMLASSHAQSFYSPYQHANPPFGTGYPMPPMPLSGGTVLVDSSSGRRQFVPRQSRPSGPTSAVYSSYYPSPYLVNLSDGSNSGSRHHWDLNAGPLVMETERSTFPLQMNQLSFVNANPVPVYQAGMYQATGAVVKSKLHKEL